MSNQLAKMEKDFKSGSPFPELPMIMDHKAFQVLPLRPSLLCPRYTLLYWSMQSSHRVRLGKKGQSVKGLPSVPLTTAL